MKINSNKRIIVLCDLGVGGERGRVFAPRSNAPAVTATEYKDPMKVIRRWTKSVSGKPQKMDI